MRHALRTDSTNKSKKNHPRVRAAVLKLIFSLVLLWTWLLLPLLAEATQLRIAQIDPATLLLDQQVDAWVSVTANGKPLKQLTQNDFQLYESPDGSSGSWQPVEITGFSRGDNYRNGVTMLLLIDNSGSMYRTLSGRVSADPARQRIAIARRTIKTFLRSVSNPADRIGLAAFNTRLQDFSAPTTDRSGLHKALQKIKLPTPQESYTELYAAVTHSAASLSRVRGRKVIIVLSDGRNDPFYNSEKQQNPQFGTRIYTPLQAQQACSKAGVSLFAVNFSAGRMRDRHLGLIARNSGGLVFEAPDGPALSRMYARIIDLVINEYRISYRATMQPAGIKQLRVTLRDSSSAERSYFSSTMFGLPRGVPWWLLLPLLLALLLLTALSRARFTRPAGGAELEILEGARTVMFDGIKPAATMALDKAAKTVIGLQSGNTVISQGNGAAAGENATIIFDSKRQDFVLNATRPVRVNNNPVVTRRLKAGDVVSIDGNTFVFDEGEEEQP